MKVAIIDDGICGNIINCYRNLNHFYIKNDIIIAEDIYTNHITHGTICAFILMQIENNIELNDIRIFTEKKSCVEDAIIALEWCLHNSISIINMSFGTINFLDFKKMEPILQKLINRGSLIVAAHTNYFIWSYPAVCQKVIGVRRDIGKILKNGEFGYQLCNNLRIENSFIAKYDGIKLSKKTYSAKGNSFAAPVITGHIAKYLLKNPNANYDQVLEFLIKSSYSDKCKSNTIEKVISVSLTISTPVIAFYMDDIIICEQLKNMFISKGYRLISLTDSKNEEFGIPINLYCNIGVTLSKEIISTIELIYEADIYFLSLYKYRYSSNSIWDLIDILVVNEENYYLIKSKGRIYKCNNLIDIYEYIKMYFESEK